MFTNQEAEVLIRARKQLENPNQNISLKGDKVRIGLISDEEPDYKFFIEANPNTKIQFKMTLHSQEKSSCVGLLRIDYKGSHFNPSHYLDTLPDFLVPYIGVEFRREAHIHFYVEGYKPLVWAMPLSAHAFEIKELTTASDYAEALTKFADMLNVETAMNIQTAIV